MESYPLFIKDVKSTGEFREIRSPYSGEVVAKIERADSAANEQALRNAVEAFESEMKTMPAHRRAQILYRVAELIRENHEELALTIAREGGKPLRDARAEVTRAANTTKMSGDEALQLNGEQLTMDRSVGSENCLAYTVRVPVGPVLAISAFNHPLNLICHQVCTAIAAGNSVIVKPASQTPISCLRMAQFFKEAGLADGVISVATAAGAETDQLVSDDRIRFVTFIGGEDVGWEIRRKVHPGVRIALEHGGTGTAIVDRSASLDRAIPSIMKGAFYHAGQVCVSTQILYVHEEIVDEVVSRLKSAISELITGDPSEESTMVGPLISKGDVDRIDSWVKEAVSAGAELVIGGNVLDNNCFEPTLLRGTDSSMKVISNEIFGPVLCVQSYSDMREPVEAINTSRYSFQSALYTGDVDQALSSPLLIETKALIINDSTAFRVDWMPFGGSKASGLGTGGTRHSVHDMTEERLVVVRIHGQNADR